MLVLEAVSDQLKREIGNLPLAALTASDRKRMLHVDEFRAPAELESFREDWGRLLSSTPRASFHQSLDWLLLYWRYFGESQQLRVCTIRADEQLIGIVPLVVRTEPTRIGDLRVLTYPLQDWGSFYGPIGPYPSVSLSVVLRYIRQCPRDWDLIDLRWVDKSDGYDEGVASALEGAGFASVQRKWRQTAVVDFQGDWEQYLASRTAKFRNNLRRAETIAAQSGEISFQRYRPPSSVDAELNWSLYDECQEMAHRSWQAASVDGTTITHPSVREFFRELFAVAGRAGALDLNVLRRDGTIIAFAYNLVMRGRITGLRIGFDVAQSSISPGRLLFAHSLQDSFARADSWLDLGSESMAFKRQWLTRTLEILQYTHYPKGSLKSQLLRTKHWLWSQGKTLQNRRGYSTNSSS